MPGRKGSRILLQELDRRREIVGAHVRPVGGEKRHELFYH